MDADAVATFLKAKPSPQTFPRYHLPDRSASTLTLDDLLAHCKKERTPSCSISQGRELQTRRQNKSTVSASA